MLDYIKVGKIFYNTKRSRGVKRLVVFVARCYGLVRELGKEGAKP